MMKITFLGTGTSHGVPQIDCMLSDYRRCRSDVCRKSVIDPRHRRTRSSALLGFGGKRVLIDVTPDFRQQALREAIPAIDAVLITHAHADHMNGIPDIRSYTRERPLDFYGSGESMAAVKSTYGYIFDPATVVGGGIPRIALHPVAAPFELFGRTATPLPVTHGGCRGCFGYRIGDVAYIPDVKFIGSDVMAELGGLACLVIDCLRIEREHSTHIILPESLAIARQLAPRKCYFVHMCHDVDYVADSALLEPWMAFAWDGLTIESGAEEEKEE